MSSSNSPDDRPKRPATSDPTLLAIVEEEGGSADANERRDPECLKGQVALVTGDSRRITVSLAHAFAQAGADVATSVVLRTSEHAELPDITDVGRLRPHNVAGMKTRESEITTSFGGTIESLDAIDILLYAADDLPFNAPYSAERGFNLAEATESRLDKLKGVCHSVLPYMADRGAGSVIIITAPSRLRPWPDIASQSARFVVLELVQMLSETWSPYGVRVNAISPGWVESSVSSKANGRANGPDHRPLRAGPESSLSGVIAAATWLASDASCRVNGAHLALSDHLHRSVFPI